MNYFRHILYLATDDHSFNSPYITFTNGRIFGSKGHCPNKIVSLLEDDNILPTMGHIFPKNFLGTKI